MCKEKQQLPTLTGADMRRHSMCRLHRYGVVCLEPLAAGDTLCTGPLMLKGQGLHRLYPGTGYRFFNAKAPLLQLSLPGGAVKSLMGCERCSGDFLQSTTGGSALVIHGRMVDYISAQVDHPDSLLSMLPCCKMCLLLWYLPASYLLCSICMDFADINVTIAGYVSRRSSCQLNSFEAA